MASSGGSAETLNEHHRRRLLVTCQHIDGMLSELEAVLNQSASKSAFPKYIDDIPSVRQRRIEERIARVRVQLTRVLEDQGIPPPIPFVSASHAVHVSLRFMNVSVEELRPKYMRGYGEVPVEAANDLNGIADELQETIRELEREVSREENNES